MVILLIASEKNASVSGVQWLAISSTRRLRGWPLTGSLGAIGSASPLPLDELAACTPALIRAFLTASRGQTKLLIAAGILVGCIVREHPVTCTTSPGFFSRKAA